MPTTVVFAFDGPLARGDVAPLCERMRALLERSGADVVVCELGTGVVADAVTVDALARLQLTARRLARRLRVPRLPADLAALLAFVGLEELFA
jgi:ABC-type transporter Mla MlaB component